MEKRWQTCTDNSSWDRTVTVTNGERTTIKESRDLDAGQIFFRKKLTKPLEFSNANGDFDYFYEFERNPSDRCQIIYIRLQHKCAGQWQTYWTGTFSAGSGKWDLDACRFEVQPETLDKYSCLLSKKDYRHNILRIAPVTAEASVAIDVEFTFILKYSGPDYGAGLIYSDTPGSVDADGVAIAPWVQCGGSAEFVGSVVFIGNDPINTAVYWVQGVPITNVSLTTMVTAFIYGELGGPFGLGADPYTFHIYRHTLWRQRFTTACIDGVPVLPTGDFWELLEDNCAVDGTATFVRPPQFTYTGDSNLYPGTYVNGVPIPPPDPSCNSWIYVADNWVSITPTPLFICFSYEESNVITIARARLLEDAGNFILEQMDCGSAIMRSDFYEWDPPGDAPGYFQGTNYVTGAPSQVLDLCIVQKTDAINPDASNPASIGEMTFSEFMRFALVCHRVYWDVDANRDVRLEHWTYWVLQQGMDLRDITGVQEALSYSHITGLIPRIERAKFAEAQLADFIGNDIVYSGPCVTGDEVNEISPGKITTDITFVVTDPNAIAKEGFVVLATKPIDGVYVTIIDQGAISLSNTANAPLSWANLQRDYWTWDRPFKYGNMNGADTVFDGFLPNIEQGNVTASLCCDLLVYNPRDLMTTALSVRIGAIGAICETVEHDVDGEISTFNLRYPL